MASAGVRVPSMQNSILAANNLSLQIYLSRSIFVTIVIRPYAEPRVAARDLRFWIIAQLSVYMAALMIRY